MGLLMDNNSSDTVDLIERSQAGDTQALNELFSQHRERLPERALVGDLQGVAGKIGRATARALATAWPQQAKGDEEEKELGHK